MLVIKEIVKIEIFTTMWEYTVVRSISNFRYKMPNEIPTVFPEWIELWISFNHVIACRKD